MGSALHHLEQASTFRCYSSGEFSAASAWRRISPKMPWRSRSGHACKKTWSALVTATHPTQHPSGIPCSPSNPCGYSTVTWRHLLTLLAPTFALLLWQFLCRHVPEARITLNVLFCVFQVLWEQPMEMGHGWRIVMQYLCLPLLYLCICVYRLHIPNVQYNIYVWDYLFWFNIFVRKIIILRLLLLFLFFIVKSCSQTTAFCILYIICSIMTSDT